MGTTGGRLIAILRVAVFATALLLGGCTAVLGAHDLLFAVRAAERVIGGTLLVLGLTSAYGAYRRLRGRVDRLTLGCLLVGSLAGLLLGVTQWVSYGLDSNTKAWLWAAFVVPILGALEVRSHGIDLAIGGLVSKIGAATVLTTLVGLIPLAAQTFRPVQQPATLDATVTVATTGMREDPMLGTVHLIETQVHARNRTGRSLVVLGSLCNVQAGTPVARGMDEADAWNYPAELLVDGSSARFEEGMDLDAVESVHNIFETGRVLEPGQRADFRVVSVVPVHLANTVAADVWVGTAFADRMQLGSMTSAPDGSFNQYMSIWQRYEMIPTSWVQGLVRDDTEVSVEYFMLPLDNMQDGAGTDFNGLYGDVVTGSDRQAAIFGEDFGEHADPEYRRRLTSTYGIGFARANDFNVVDVKTP